MSSIDTTISISLAVLAFTSILLVIVLVPIGLQLTRTLSSLQNLMDTVNEDLEPTAKDIRHSVDCIKDVANKCKNGTKGFFNKAGVTIVSSSHGLLTGVKSYLRRSNNV